MRIRIDQEFALPNAFLTAEKLLLVAEQRVVHLPDGHVKRLLATVEAVYAEDAQGQRRQVWGGGVVEQARREVPTRGVPESWLARLAEILWGPEVVRLAPVTAQQKGSWNRFVRWLTQP